MNKNNNISYNNLLIINNVEFTQREIDVITCVIHNRGEKKIAEILGISTKTVSTHIHNIMRKIQCGSREYIIDFIEKSNKLIYIRQHYNQLKSQLFYYKTIEKIAEVIKSSNIRYTVRDHVCNDLTANILENIILNLTIAKFIIVKEDKYINNISHYIQIVDSHCFHTDLCQLSGINIFIVDNKFDYISNYNNTENVLFVQFNHHSQDYSPYLELINLIAQNKQVTQFINEYREYYKNLTDISADNPNREYNWWIGYLRKYQYIITAIIFIVVIIIMKIHYYDHSSTYKHLTQHQLDFKKLSILQPNLKIYNLEKAQAEINYSIIQEYLPIIDHIIDGNIYKAFDASKLKATEFTEYLYNLNATANYFLFKTHDAVKAEKILHYAKAIAEDYVNKRSGININFSQLSPLELHTELAVISDIPEMYTTTLYFLGRCAIYQKQIDKAKFYFSYSKILGHNLNMFYGILSDLNGLLVVDGEQAEVLLQNKNNNEAEILIKRSIDSFKIMKNNNSSYKYDYRPNNFDPKIIIPNQDFYHTLHCATNIIRLYIKLMKVTEDKVACISYIKDILNELFDNNQIDSGLLPNIIKAHDKYNRLAANLYNNLGLFLLEIYKKKISLKDTLLRLKTCFGFTKTAELDCIYEIFALSKSISRNFEFTKADAYAGLIKVNQLYLEKLKINDEIYQQIITDIKFFQLEQAKINKHLHRVN